MQVQVRVTQDVYITLPEDWEQDKIEDFALDIVTPPDCHCYLHRKWDMQDIDFNVNISKIQKVK
jgi:hypothetical protein